MSSVHEISQRFHKEIFNLVKAKQQAISGGNLEDFPAYKSSCGEVRGLEQALDTFKQVLKDLNRQDIDDDDELNEEVN